MAWRYHTESLTVDSAKRISRAPANSYLALQGAEHTPAPDLERHAGMVAFVRGHESLRGAPAQLFRELSEYVVFAPTTAVLRGVIPDPDQRDPLGPLGGRLAEAIEELLDPAAGKLGRIDFDEVLELLDWVASFDVGPPSAQILSPSVPALRRVVRFRDHWMRDGRNQLSGYDASEGALYVLFLLSLVLHPRAPLFFAVDNFDQAMHPRLARSMVRLFAREALAASPPRQVLLTTHNPLVLDGLDLRDERIRLFTVERGSDGATRIQRIEVSPDVLAASQQGLSLSNLWVMGRLGGVPDLG